MNPTTNTALQRRRGPKAVIYGQAGSGKTLLTATAPSPYLISIEGGTMSLAAENIARVFDGQPHTAEFPVVECTTIQEAWEAITWMQSEEAQRHCIIIDSVTALAELWLQHIKTTTSNNDGRAVYGRFNEEFVTLCNLMQRLPQPVFLSAQLDREKDALSDALMYRPRMPGQQVPLQLPHIFDFLLVMRQTPAPESARYLQTAADNQWVAKDRSGRLEAAEPPHLGALIAKVMA